MYIITFTFPFVYYKLTYRAIFISTVVVVVVNVVELVDQAHIII